MPLKILILIPTHDYVSALTMFDAMQLCLETAAAMPPDGHQIGTQMVTHTYIHRARQELAEVALAEKATHLLWMDADMRFPQDALLKLLEHDKKCVGINYAKRGVPSDFVAIKHLPEYNNGVGAKCITNDDSTGLEEVDAMGMGLVLMKASAFNNMPDPAEKPWFWFGFTEQGGHIGEDVHFFKLLKESGVPVYVDHDLSKRCAHVGQFEFRTKHASVEYYAGAKKKE
ncbi:MAG: hypothetical protein AB7R40_23345 [Nitrospiraceae bacterium]